MAPATATTTGGTTGLSSPGDVEVATLATPGTTRLRSAGPRASRTRPGTTASDSTSGACATATAPADRSTPESPPETVHHTFGNRSRREEPSCPSLADCRAQEPRPARCRAPEMCTQSTPGRSVVARNPRMRDRPMGSNPGFGGLGCPAQHLRRVGVASSDPCASPRSRSVCVVDVRAGSEPMPPSPLLLRKLQH